VWCCEANVRLLRVCNVEWALESAELFFRRSSAANFWRGFMPNRLPGALCASRLGLDWIDDGTMCLGRSEAPGTVGLTPGLLGPFDQHFQVFDSLTGRPMAHTPYRIRLESGAEHFGITDACGYTQKVGANQVQMATLEIPFHGNRTSSIDPGEQHGTCSR